jgi:HD-like signal output (HDOD) protein
MMEKIIEKIKNLPPVSDIVNELQTLCYNDDYTATDVEKVIKKDPSLVANVLKIANSPYYGLPREFIDIRQAIVYFGLEQLIEFAFATVMDNVLNFDLDFYHIDSKTFIKMSQLKAAVAGGFKLHKNQKILVSNTAFLADISKIIISSYAKEQNFVLEPKDYILNELDIVEKNIFGFDTIDVTIEIFDYWNFEVKMIELLKEFKEQKNQLHKALYITRDVVTIKGKIKNLEKHLDIKDDIEKISKEES